MTDENKVADVLSGLLTLSDDLPDAKTKEQKAMWSIEAKMAMGEAFALINEMVVDRHQLKSENEALRKDAERYRWLRDKQTFIWLIQDWFPSDAVLTDVDAEIDAAMAKGVQS